MKGDLNLKSSKARSDIGIILNNLNLELLFMAIIDQLLIIVIEKGMNHKCTSLKREYVWY